MLAWDEAEVAECLEVLPTVEEYGISYAYVVAADGLRLHLTIWPLDSDVTLTLHRDGVEAPVFAMDLVDCEAIRHVTDRSGEWLEFAPAKCFGGRYHALVSIPYGFRVAIKPSIQISVFAGSAP